MTIPEKRYQIFISSTFEDLKDERRAVQDVIINTGDFPVQMESFPAADEDQFEFIKSLIDKCDYYILIIAGRYGTVAEDGLSYTEKEYQYAVSIGVPVLVMLHSDRGSLSVDKSETSVNGRKHLERFINEASSGRLRKDWKTPEGLKLAVREALDHAKQTRPAKGWVRGDQISSRETLEELNTVRKENAEYRKALGEVDFIVPLPDLPAYDELLQIDIMPSGVRNAMQGSHATIKCSWISVFPLFFSNLCQGQNDWNGEWCYHIEDDESCVKIGSALAAEVSKINTMGSFRISSNMLERLTDYYIECGLMYPEGAEGPFTEQAKKFARRQRVANPPSAGFKVVEGKVHVLPNPTSDLDDEIPF